MIDGVFSLRVFIVFRYVYMVDYWIKRTRMFQDNQ